MMTSFFADKKDGAKDAAEIPPSRAFLQSLDHCSRAGGTWGISGGPLEKITPSNEVYSPRLPKKVVHIVAVSMTDHESKDRGLENNTFSVNISWQFVCLKHPYQGRQLVVDCDV